MGSIAQDFELACRMHSEALWCYHVLQGGGRNSEGGDSMVKSAEWCMKFRGWTDSQVQDYRFDQEELPHKCPKVGKGESFMDSSNGSEGIKRVLRRLHRKASAPGPAPEDLARRAIKTILGKLRGTALAGVEGLG